MALVTVLESPDGKPDRVAFVPEGFAWLTPPLLNHGTRLAAVLRPAEGRVELVAHEGERRVSEPFSITEAA